MAAYCYYTQTTPTNNLKWTTSMWVKRANIRDSNAQYIMTVWVDGSNHWVMRFVDEKLDIYNTAGGSQTGKLRTSRIFRDPAAWYHIVFVYDSANADAGNRMRLYINGIEETSFTTDTQPAQDAASIFNISGRVVEIGRRGDSPSSNFFDGRMSHIQFVDGLALAPTEFGEVDSTSGIWKIKTGAYATPGNNGFFLKMEDRTNLDLDSSSNAFTFTTSGDLTPTYDNPSNNFATFNPLDNFWQGDTGGNWWTYANSNTSVTTDTTGNWGWNTATMCPAAGLWYWEIKMGSTTGTCYVGISDAVMPVTSHSVNESATAIGVIYKSSNGYIRKSTSSGDIAYGNSYTVGDIIGVYLDITAAKIYFAKNGTIQDSGTGIDLPLPNNNGWWSPVCQKANGGNIFHINFGNGYFASTAVTSAVADEGGIGAFEYDPSDGGASSFDGSAKDFRALCSKNLKVYGG